MASLAGGLVERQIERAGAVDAGDGGIPVALDRRLAARLKREHVPGRQAADALEEGPRRRDVAEGEIGGNRARVEPPRHGRVREDRLQLAAEDQPPAAVPVEEWLLA